MLAFLRIPFDVLIALDNRTLHFYLQPVHYLIRLVHVLSASAFFGGIGLLDMRLMGWRGSVMLRPYAEHVLPVLYATFGVAAVTGVTLFLYDPVHVGSHAFFVPKLLLLVFGVINALLYHQTGYVAALAAERHLPTSARVAGRAVARAMDRRGGLRLAERGRRAQSLPAVITHSASRAPWGGLQAAHLPWPLVPPCASVVELGVSKMPDDVHHADTTP